MTQRETYQLDFPISIIGAARSGTTLLAEILSQHPTVSYWVEPKYIWRYRRPSAPNDVRTRKEATAPIRRYIRTKFADYVDRSEGDRFMEKTPSNCFRVPFVHAVLPDVRIVHLLRDGRDVAFSAREKWTSPPKKEALWRRFTSVEIPLRDVPAYVMDFLRDVIGRQLDPESGYVWGPQFPGIHEVKKEHSILETCAIQWRESVKAARDGLSVVPDAQKKEVRFEELVRKPSAVVEDICRFLDLGRDQIAEYAARIVQPEAADRWRNRSDEEIKKIMPHINEMVGQVRSQEKLI